MADVTPPWLRQRVVRARTVLCPHCCAVEFPKYWSMDAYGACSSGAASSPTGPWVSHAREHGSHYIEYRLKS